MFYSIIKKVFIEIYIFSITFKDIYREADFMKKILRVIVCTAVFILITVLLVYGLSYGIVNLGEKYLIYCFFGIVLLVVLGSSLYMLYDCIKMLKHQKRIIELEKEGKLVRIPCKKDEKENV